MRSASRRDALVSPMSDPKHWFAAAHLLASWSERLRTALAESLDGRGGRGAVLACPVVEHSRTTKTNLTSAQISGAPSAGSGTCGGPAAVSSLLISGETRDEAACMGGANSLAFAACASVEPAACIAGTASLASMMAVLASPSRVAACTVISHGSRPAVPIRRGTESWAGGALALGRWRVVGRGWCG